MRAMVFEGAGRALRSAEVPDPIPGPFQVLLRVRACGVCRTDLHLIDGELPGPKLPVIPGHQIVGEVVTIGEGVDGFAEGDRVGVPWLGATCGRCRYCLSGRENLCPHAQYTGHGLDGGFAELAVANASFCFRLPDPYPAIDAAPLLCAGLIGYRTLRMAGDAARIGIYGFGAAAHLVAQIVRFEGRALYAFVRPGDEAAAVFARSLGATWVGGSDERPPVALDAALIFAPVGSLVPAALAAVAPGGMVVCGGIHMSDIPSFPYALLWGERTVRSVANLTRRDGHELLALAPKIPLRTTVQPYPLARANEALDDLRAGRFSGAAVLVP